MKYYLPRQLVAAGSWLKRNWPYGASLALLTLSINLVWHNAASGQAVDDCWRVMADCQTNIETKPPVTANEFLPSDVLALTDYYHYLTYKIEFHGELESTTDTDQFIAQTAETLADSRGWARAGYTFSRVQVSSQADFILILIEAKLLANIPGCSSQWSCRSGNNVYINEDRWNGGTSAWNSAGGNLRDYRHMVVNHETGHYLGLGHYNCSDGINNLAPVMQQQSIDLQGCNFNPWPLTFEINAV